MKFNLLYNNILLYIQDKLHELKKEFKIINK